MIPKKAHALLSDLHTLLATYEAVDFTDAARFSPELASALRVLSKKTGLQEFTVEASLEANPFSEKPRSKPSRSNSSIQDAEDIRGILSRTAQTETSSSIVAFGKKLGFSIQANPKDSKDRLLRRLSTAIASLSRDRRAQIISQILRNANSQTQGWVDVIKGRE